MLDVGVRRLDVAGAEFIRRDDDLRARLLELLEFAAGDTVILDEDDACLGPFADLEAELLRNLARALGRTSGYSASAPTIATVAGVGFTVIAAWKKPSIDEILAFCPLGWI